MLKHILCLLFLLFLSSLDVLAQSSDNSPLIYRVVDKFTSVSNGGAYISVIDALTQKEIGQIEFTSTCINIELSSDQARAFLTTQITFSDDGILVFDLAARRQIANLFARKSVCAAKIAPNGALWVTLCRENTVVIVDSTTLKQIATISTPDAPEDIVFSPDGKRAYVSVATGNILVIDTQRRTITSTIAGLPAPAPLVNKGMELAISPDGGILVRGGKDTFSLIDTNSLRLTDKVMFSNSSSPSQSAVVFSPDGKTLYIAETQGANLYAYNLATKVLTNIFTIPGILIQDIKLSPDGRLLYVSDRDGRSIIDTQTKELVFSIQDFPILNQFVSQGIALARDFTIGQAPVLQTLFPTADQQVTANQPITIKWQTTVAENSFSIAKHKVELSTDGGATFAPIPGGEELGTRVQAFTWQVPNVEIMNKAQNRVSTVDLGARRTSSSTGNFSIVKNGSSGSGDTQAPTVNFLSPKGGEKFESGSTLPITWTSSDNVGVTAQNLSLSTDGGTTFPVIVVSGLMGSAQSFSFPIPTTLQTDQAKLRLTVTDAAGNMAQAITSSNFAIQLGADTTPPTVTISQPTTSQNLIAGQSIQVKWQSTDNNAIVNQALLLSFDAGKTFNQVASFGANDNSFVLSNIDNLNFTTSQAVVKITATDSFGNKGEANASFTIAPAITQAVFQAKVLSISGIGFMSNSSTTNAIKLFVNGKEIALSRITLSNTAFSVNSNKKKLNLVKGTNSVMVVVDGVSSNTAMFTF